MGFRFRKRIKIAPGIHANLSKSGVSYSLGGRGATLNVGGKRGTRMTVGVPGSRISYSQRLGSSPHRQKRDPSLAQLGSAIPVIDSYASARSIAGQLMQESETALDTFRIQVQAGSLSMAKETLDFGCAKSKAAYSVLLSQNPPTTKAQMHQGFLVGLGERIEAMNDMESALDLKKRGDSTAADAAFHIAEQRYARGTEIIEQAGKPGRATTAGQAPTGASPLVMAIVWGMMGLIVLVLLMYVFPLVLIGAGVPGLLLLTNYHGRRAWVLNSRMWSHVPWLRHRSPTLAGAVLVAWAVVETLMGISAYAG